MSSHPSDRLLAEFDRSLLRTSRRALDAESPLVRSEVRGLIGDESLEVPVPPVVENEQVRVLHVDDDPRLGELTRDHFERIDDQFEVVTAASAVGALDRLDDKRFDCVVSDYEMPNTNGLELLEIVRERYPDLPFILFTGKGSEAIASDAIAAGVTDYMQKELTADQYEVLANRVQNAVEQYRTQERFWNALSWYRHLLEQDIAGVFLLQDGRFAYVNDRLAELFGHPKCQLVGSSLADVAASTDDSLARLAELDSGSETMTVECLTQGIDGTERRVTVYCAAVEYDSASGCIGLAWPTDS